MRRISSLAHCLLTCISLCFSAFVAHAANEIDAPRAISAGQSATLKWYFTGTKVTISGGQFPPGTVITGRQSLKVTPKKTTTYVFDVYFKPGVEGDQQKTVPGKLIHAQYRATVEVLSASQPGMLTYKGSRGWRISYQAGWRPMPNREGSDDLIFFQQEEDAVERLAVAVVPVKDKTAQQLIDDVRADIPSNYTHYQLLSQSDFTHQSLPAVIATFSGNAQAHPDTRTTSMLMVVVNGDMGYVVSVRTHADRLSLRQATLEKMLHSLVLTGKIEPVRTAEKHDPTSGPVGKDASVPTGKEKTVEAGATKS